MSSKHVIIFDFDGTIADTVPVIIDIFHKVDRRKTRLNEDEELLVRSAALLQVKMKVIVRNAAKIGIPLWRLPFLFAISQMILSRRMQEVEAFPGVRKLIQELHEQGYLLFIVSANSQSNIRKFLKKEGLLPCFAKIYGSTRSHSKAKVMKRIMNRYQVAPERAYYIGDEDRDMFAAQNAGVKSIGVTWGYNDRQQLEAANPTAVVASADDLRTIISRA